MNIPSIVCYLTPVRGNPKTLINKCGKDRQIELLKAFQELGFNPMVDGQNKPTVESCSRIKNAIVYVWLKEDDEKPKRNLSMGVFGIPVETLTDKRFFVKEKFDYEIAALQYYNEPVTKDERLSIAGHIVDLMIGDQNAEKTDRIKRLYAKGVFEGLPVMTCSTSHTAGTIVIRPDTAPKPEDFVDPAAKTLVLK